MKGGPAAAHRLSRLLAPRSIAFVGASTREGSIGNMMARTIVAGGFPGDVHLINPRYTEIEGLPCRSSLGELDGPPDLVVAGVGGARVEAVLDEAIAIGAGGVVIFDACHGADEAGRPLLSRLKDKAREADMPVCGGNGMGFLNIPERCHVSFYSARDLKPGGITLIAHSGSVFTVLALNDPRYRFDLAVSPGQEIGATIDEYLDYALERPETRVVALFMEAARRPDRFAEALAKAAAREVPVVVCKVGRTAESARLARSHSGALAGSDAAYDAVLERYGALRVETVDQLMNAALLLSQGPPSGPGGLAFVTDSGGLRETLIDRADQRGIALAALSPATLAKLEAVLPAPLVPSNPLDAAGSFTGDFATVFEQGLRLLAGAPEVGLLGYEFDGRDDFHYEPRLAALAERLPELTAKPCFAYSSFGNTNNRELAARLADAGVPLINGQDEMLSAAAAALRWRDMKAALSTPDAPPAAPEQRVVGKWRRALSARSGLSEAEGLGLLRDFEVPVVPHHVAEDWPAVLAAAAELGFPVALKSAAEGLEHKSDVGGVRLNLDDAEALQAAYRDLDKRLGSRVTVQAMAPRGVELAFGCLVDPDFGPLVMVSAGGTLIELLSDRSFALAPFGPGRARRMIDRLKGRKLLDGLRGAPPCDLEALCRTLARFSVMCGALSDVLGEVDVNPVIVGQDGVLAVDALVATSKGCNPGPE
ncbi:MAG: acetate--CoA ligase family protein [Rhodospirillales bacterium]|nr:acetate--CoA ligase family protein [Rhodospirillales bacterium]